MKRLRKRSGAEIAKLYAPFAASALIGGLVSVMCPIEWVNRLGEGFLVAGLVGIFIELTAAGVLISDVSDELSSLLIGAGLPSAAQDLIHRIVHKTKLVRRDYRKLYRIERHPTRPGYVILYITISHKTVNNGRSTEDYAPYFAEEGMYCPRISSLQYRDYVRPKPQPSVSSETKVCEWKDFQSVKISPSLATAALEMLSPEQVCEVHWVYTIEMPEYYSDLTCFAGLTINPTLELESKPNDLCFYAALGEEFIHAADGLTWTYQRAYVEGQTLRVWWQPL
jgi:hypothetical protein